MPKGVGEIFNKVIAGPEFKQIKTCIDLNEHKYHTMGISSMSGSFSWSTTQFTAASTLALPKIEKKNW